MTTKQQSKETATAVASDYPKRWVFDKESQGKADWIDGPVADGSFVRFEQGRTEAYGAKPIAILEVDGAERSVWLLHDAVFNRFRDELQRRSIPKLVPGERVVIEKLAEKVKSKNDREYVGYRVMFPDAPAPDEESLFGLASRAPEPASGGAVETEASPDDIPF